MSSPAEIIRAANDRWPHQFSDELEAEIIGPRSPNDEWLLVERSTITRDYHLSTHDSLDSIRSYSNDQEYAEDWEPRVAIHLLSEQVTELQRTYDIEATPTGETTETYTDWRA